MAPTYTPLAPPGQQSPRQRTRAWIRVLWVLQAAVVLLRMLVVSLVLVAFFAIGSVLGAPALLFTFVVLILAFDIFLAGSIVVCVYRQLFRPIDRQTALRREVYKAAIATWLFVSFASLPKDGKYAKDLDEQQREVVDRVVRKIWIGKLLVTVVIIGLFYPPLWVAYKERQAEKEQADKGWGEIELEDHETQLLGRVSMDTLDGLVEEDGEVDGPKLKV